MVLFEIADDYRRTIIAYFVTSVESGTFLMDAKISLVRCSRARYPSKISIFRGEMKYVDEIRTILFIITELKKCTITASIHFVLYCKKYSKSILQTFAYLIKRNFDSY